MPYVFRIDEFEIRRTRALRTDTDLVGFLLRVGDHTYPPVMFSIGDVQDGKHPINAVEIGPIDVPDDATPVVISYSIVNSGDLNQIKSNIQFVLDSFADAGANMSYAFGTLVNRFLMFPFHAFEFSSCDGIVAMDVIALYGRTLSALTHAGTRYSEIRPYPGRLNTDTPEYNAMYPSPGACGDTSDYSVTWSVESVPAGTGQRELVRDPGVLSIAGYPTADKVQHVVLGSRGLDGGDFTSISMSAQDGGIVHEDQDPKGSIPDLVKLAAWDAGLTQHVIAATFSGNLIFATTSLDQVGTTLEQVPLPVVEGVVALAGFFPSVGGLPITSFAHHIFVGMDNGTIRYLVRADTPDSWTERGFVNIGSGRHLVGLASYVSDQDGCGHVIAACDDGDVLDVRVSPDASSIEPTFLDVRANIPNPVAVAGYFGPSIANDNYHHIYVASKDGNIHEIWFPGVATAGQGGVSVRTQFSNVQAIAAYFGPDDNQHHIVAASADGSIQVSSRTA